jgi:hypothetical protein
MALCTECGTEVEQGSKRGRRCEWDGGCQFQARRPIHLGFDHLPGHEKSFELGKAQMLGKTVEEVRAELAKCQVLCHNHHAETTALRGKMSVALRAEIELQRDSEDEHA